MRKELLLAAALTGLMTVAHAEDKKAAPAVAKKEVKGECSGVNSCKGTGECGGKDHSCAGKNTCKGQGWVTKTEKECKELKGTWSSESSMK
jgi:hypothetical protein